MSACNLYQIAMGLVWACQILSTNINAIVAHNMNMLSIVAFVCISSFSSFGVVEELRCESQGSPFQEATTTSGLGIRPQYLRKLRKCVPSIRTYQKASTEVNLNTEFCV
jgi:hypothetical protein